MLDDRRCGNLGGGISGKHNLFKEIISLDNLLQAWEEFKYGKMRKKDVVGFYFDLEDNLLDLRASLMDKSYAPAPYAFFYVRDPKLRPIHKATVCDRVLFQAVFRVLYPLFDRHFIFDSYSCRFEKGTHAGVRRLCEFAAKVSENYHRPVYALKCDVQKFFYNIDHRILLRLLKREITDENVIWLLEKIVGSFNVGDSKGLPLGNVTSQLFANVYLNELDQFVKHILKGKFYLRYCDDFIILNNDAEYLVEVVPVIQKFLDENLKLNLHPRKVEICKLSQGIDFLGYVSFSRHTVLRTKTKQRMLKKMSYKRSQLIAGEIKKEKFNQVLQSYLGVLGHCDGYNLENVLKNSFQNQTSSYKDEAGRRGPRES
ncbi:MAG: hypothetical protein A2261_03100 [Candidatus Magasanikbacteria bacterium RIFOXYA2_FULL_44_8]|uniref:Reverse transcriptase domain-containing protein n=1 Tax=Candidatus Magasanikbacteria bacterium RIFOXYA2_FULL_44_8 TaxID=1798696 RepID=A0A1F6NLH1_9BACT|nr:MAG: hypothetical protein A2261_03100 [Candidatus Magasanikbacteria bacterium RIFOXYA2_FULL_44_8]